MCCLLPGRLGVPLPPLLPLTSHMQTSSSLPGVTVSTRGILGDCPVHLAGVCTFAYVAALTPRVTAINATAVTVGSALAITGTGFSGAANTTVSIGGVSPCAVVSATSTRLVCIVGNAPAGSFNVSVEVLANAPGAPVGIATSAAPLRVTVSLSIASISPASGSQAGGALITIAGNGFAAAGTANVVTIGGAPCAVVSSSLSAVTCLAPANALGPAETAAPVLVNGVATGRSFQYLNAQTPVLVGLSPASLSSALSGTVTLQLTGVPAGAPIAVSFGARVCTTTAGSITYPDGGATTVACTLTRAAPLPLPQAPVAPTVSVGTWGYAAAGSLALDTGFRVDAVSVAEGSLLGGTSVTFDGCVSARGADRAVKGPLRGTFLLLRPLPLLRAGFSAVSYQDSVDFYHVDSWGYEWLTPCIIASVSPASLTCTTTPVEAYQRGTAGPAADIAGVFLVLVNNITAPCGPAAAGCAFAMTGRATPQVTSADVTGSTLALSGAFPAVSAAAVSVTVGAYACTNVVVVAADEVDCTLPVGAAGTAPISLSIDGYGAANVTAPPYTFPLSVGFPLSVSGGSIAGGAVVTLVGAGFYLDPPGSGLSGHNVVMFGGAQAFVRASTETSLVVVAPPRASAASVDVAAYVLTPDYASAAASVVSPRGERSCIVCLAGRQGLLTLPTSAPHRSSSPRPSSTSWARQATSRASRLPRAVPARCSPSRARASAPSHPTTRSSSEACPVPCRPGEPGDSCLCVVCTL